METDVLKDYQKYSDEEIEKYIIQYQDWINVCKRNLAGICHDVYKEKQFLETYTGELRKLLKVKELRRLQFDLAHLNIFLKTYEG